MVRLDEFNIDNYLKPIKFKTKDNKYFIKKYKKKIYDNRGISMNNKFIENELLLSNIKHSNLIAFMKKEDTPNDVYIYYKYYSLPDLISIFTKDDNSVIDLLYFYNKTILTQLLNVVKFLHKNNIVHRDIKVDNILYDEVNNQVYLCDFEYCSNNEVKSFESVGTQAYSPPELINRLSIIDYEKVDIWCLGLVFFIILSKGNMLSRNDFLNINKIKNYLLDNETEFILNLIQKLPHNRLSADELLDLNYFK